MPVASYENLRDWADSRELHFSTWDRPDTGGWPGHVRRIRRLTISGAVVAEFRESTPCVVVEWGDGYRGYFPSGLPAGVLIGLVAGFLGIPAEPAKDPAQ